MKIGIIGAGASGCLCAINAALRGHEVVLLERKDRILKKVLVTGNGTCNFTNITASYDNYFSIEDKISEEIFNKYSFKDVINFFKKLGIEHVVESRGRVYPKSLQASSIVDAIRLKIDSLKNIDLRLNFDVSKVRKKNSLFNVTSVEGESVLVDKLVISTGGMSYQELGSNGSGYEISKKMGHNITELYPILVQLKIDKDKIKGLAGVKQKVNLKVYNKNKLLREDSNELLFTPYGISGPSVFNLSYLTALYGFNLDWVVDFLPEYDENELINLFKDRRENLSYLTAEYFLNGIVNKKLSHFLLKLSGVEKLNISISKIKDVELEKLAFYLKKYTLKAFDTTGFSNAQVTAGGIYINEIDNYTLESKKVKNLYFIGEVLDLFGDCGGYNLNWCFISGLHVGNII